MTLRRVDKVTVENWRNWQGESTVDGLVPGIVVLAGPNAVGKTGVWEAIVGGLLDRHWGTHTGRLRPAGTKGVIPRVTVEFTAGDSRYRVEKSFGSTKDKASFWEWHDADWVLRDQGEEAYLLCRQAVLGTDDSAPNRGGADKALKDTLMEVLLPAQGDLTSPAPAPEAVSMAITDREAATAASRVGRVLAAVSAEANEIWVGKRDRPKKGSALQVDELRRHEIEEKIEPLEVKAARIRELVSQLAQVSEESTGQTDAAQQAALADQLRRDAAEHRAHREEANERWLAADGDRERTTQLSNERRAREKTATAAASELTGSKQELERLRGKEQRAQVDCDALKKRREGLGLDEQRHREWIEFESRESELVHLRKTLDGVVDRRTRFDAQEQILAKRKAEALTLKVPKKDEWPRLDDLRESLQEAKGEFNAGAWSVSGRLPSGLSLRVDGDEVLEEGGDLQATREVEIAGPDERVLRIAAPARSADEVERIQAELRAILDRYRVADLSELRRRYNHLEQEVKPAISNAESRMEDALAGRTSTDLLRDQLDLEGRIGKKSVLEAPPCERPAGVTEEWRIRLEFLTTELGQVRQQLEVAGPEVSVLEERVRKAGQANERCKHEMETAGHALGEHRDLHGSDDDLIQNLLRAETAAKELKEAWQKLEDARPMAEQAKDLRAEKLSGGLKEVLASRDRIRQLTADIDALRREDPEGSLATLEAERAALLPGINAARTHAEALLLLERSLTTEKDRVTDAIGEPVRERLQKWIAYLLQDGSEVVVDAEGRPAVIRTPAGQEVPYEDQSFGTREQVSILHRLAVADLVAEEVGSGVVLMLDDPFGHTDRGRRSRLLDILGAEADKRGHQILIFTCRPEDFEGVGTHIALRRT